VKKPAKTATKARRRVSSRTGFMKRPSKPAVPYDAADTFKIIMTVDGDLVGIEPPKGAELCKGDEIKIGRNLSTLRYVRARCRPPCVRPKVCRCVLSGGIWYCYCR
jgi:hypothetical protein